MNDSTINQPLTNSDTSSSLPLSEREWDKLLRAIAKGRVIPVIGPELLCIPWEDHPAVRLYDLWGQTLARQQGIDAIPLPEETPLLYRIINQWILTYPLRRNSGDIEYDINDVICCEKWPVPEALRQLAGISDFPLYITTTIDHLMKTALQDARSVPLLQIIFKLRGDKTNNDLPADFVAGKQPALFHLFGATCLDPGGFAASEDALIEFSWDLIDQNYAPEHLYDFLRGKELLLIGCDFPDWLARFFIHTLTRKSDAQTSVSFVSNYRSNGLQEFLKRKGASAWPPMPPLTFVAELQRRWKQRQGVMATEQNQFRECKSGAVFISYAREDRTAALAIRAQLETCGIDTWMDESGLKPGVEFQHVIQENIEKASFFIAVISAALNFDGTDRRSRFVLEEWHWAEKVNNSRLKDDCFLQPLVVDNTPPGAKFIERPFRDLHWSVFRDNTLSPEFIDTLRKGIRRFRGNGMGVTA